VEGEQVSGDEQIKCAYLAVVLDLGSRRVVGWQVGTSMEEDLVLSALRHAIAQRNPPPSTTFHSNSDLPRR
jgi:transposase InsO family protein